LADFLSSGTMVNGYGQSDQRQFNGIGCLAAQFIAQFKDGVGNIYIETSDAIGCGEEYIYEVRYSFPEFGKTSELKLSCYDVYSEKTIFEGKPKDFDTILETV